MSPFINYTIDNTTPIFKTDQAYTRLYKQLQLLIEFDKNSRMKLQKYNVEASGA